MRMLLKPWSLMNAICSGVTIGLPQAVSSSPRASSVLPRFHPGCMAATVAWTGVIAGGFGFLGAASAAAGTAVTTSATARTERSFVRNRCN
jgi:hypothetical protein